ncbi:MAG: hypothetical protein AAGD47_05555 [Pseudomonadota bacterium]
MSGDELTGWVMAGSLSVIGFVALTLISAPETRPEEAILHCDSKGGIWSSETRRCRKSDSPLAGMAA